MQYFNPFTPYLPNAFRFPVNNKYYNGLCQDIICHCLVFRHDILVIGLTLSITITISWVIIYWLKTSHFSIR